MKKIFFLSLIFVLSMGLKAQVVVNDTISGGKFTIESEDDITKAIENKEDKNCRETIAANKAANNNGNGKAGSASGAGNVVVVPRKTVLTPGASVDPCVINPKIMGYKIQIFYSKDRLAAEAEKNNFSRSFPSLGSELTYARPDYKVLVGEYLSRGSAGGDLGRIKKRYPASFLIQWRVWCRSAR